MILISTGSRRRNVKTVKILWAVHHAYFESNLIPDVAKACNVCEDKIRKWEKTDEWQAACEFWGVTGDEPLQVYETAWQRSQHRRQRRSFAFAERKWAYMIQSGLDLFPSGIDKDPVLEKFLRGPVPYHQIGLEALTPWARFRDAIAKVRFRVEYALNAFIIYVLWR